MTTPLPAARSRYLKKTAIGVLAFLLLYFVLAYLIVPMRWVRYAHRHPDWANAPRITHTGADIPGDPLNVALIGTEAEVKRSMLAAQWSPADPLTLRSCFEIAEASVLKRKYRDAPVSKKFIDSCRYSGFPCLP